MTILQQLTTGIPDKRSMADEVTRLDPLGVGMMAIGMVVVFASLLMLYMLFAYISRLLRKKPAKAPAAAHAEPPATKPAGNGQNSEAAVAIAAALHLYFTELHDNEQAILTIRRISRTYSPWSSKIYSLRKHPRMN